MEGSERNEDATVADGPVADDGFGALEQRLPDLDGWRLIGQGGFATVYAARQERLGRLVAVKLLRERPSPNVVRWFLRECEVMGALSSHPHIVTIYDSGVTDEGRPYLVMEHLPGGSLADLITDGAPLPWREVVSIGAKVADGLAAAHQRGVLHLDIKPANVMLSEYGAAKLGDFGIARIETSGATTSVAPFSPFYVAPETIDGLRPTRATDVYALGATLSTLLRGRPPYWRADDNAVSAVITRTVAEPIPRLTDLNLPDTLSDLVGRMLARDPAKRPTVDAVLDTLARIDIDIDIDGAPAPAPPAATSAATGAGATPRRARAVIAALVLAVVAITVSVIAIANRHSGTTTSPTSAAQPTTATDGATTAPSVAPSSTRATLPPSTSLAPATPPTGGDAFPPIPGATWLPAPDAVAATVTAGIGARAPDAYIKSATVRLLQRDGQTFTVFRIDLQDATLDPATFREKFVKGLLLSGSVEQSAGSGVVFVSQGGLPFAVFAGQDHAGWAVNGDTVANAIDTAVAIMNVVGAAPL